MVQDLIQVEVTADGREYVHDRFRQIPGLSARVVPQVIEQGEVLAIVPKDTSFHRATQFEAGGLTELNLTSRWLIPHVIQELKGRSNGFFLDQDIWAEVCDVKSTITPHVISDDGRAVYYYVASSNISTASLAECIKEPLSFITAMFVIPETDVALLPGTLAIHDLELDDLARNVTELIVQAYDGESFLVWRRRPGVTPLLYSA